MELQIKERELIISGSSYTVALCLVQQTFKYYRKDTLLYHGSIAVHCDSIEAKDVHTIIQSHTCTQEEEYIHVLLDIDCNGEIKKTLMFIFHEEYLSVSAHLVGLSAKLTDIRFFSSDSIPVAKKNYSFIAPRFDWLVGKVECKASQDEILSCQQWFSPPPFSYIYTNNDQYSAIGVASPKGKQNYTAFLHRGEDDSFVLQYEGHTYSDCHFDSPSLVFCPEASSWDSALQQYRRVLELEHCLPTVQEKIIPSWWREPIFCGWGEMRYEYRRDHDNHENRNFVNVTDYCMQSRYECYLKALEEHAVNPGTIIIDMGWAEKAALGKPDPHKWPSLRSFIDMQHRKGRHVLLWFTPMVTQGLPDKVCLLLEGRPVAPDPTHPGYVAILEKQLHLMLSSESGCLDADGFKIDFTQNNPSEEGIFTGYLNSFWGLINTTLENHLYKTRIKRSSLIQVHEPDVWGIDLLHRYLENIYISMKNIKPNSLLISHTPNPSFCDVSDMLRLNNLDGNCDNVLEVMASRTKIAKSANPAWLIDTDNDLMINKTRWREYLELQPRLGVPDTYYATHIAASSETFEEDEYALLRTVFSEYRATLN